MNNIVSGCPDCGSQSILHRKSCKVHKTPIKQVSKKEQIGNSAKVVD